MMNRENSLILLRYEDPFSSRVFVLLLGKDLNKNPQFLEEAVAIGRGVNYKVYFTSDHYYGTASAFFLRHDDNEGSDILFNSIYKSKVTKLEILKIIKAH